MEDALQAKEEAAEKGRGSSSERQKDSPPAPSPYERAANEDDDGYDPWSDRREEATLWEDDPWR